MRWFILIAAIIGLGFTATTASANSCGWPPTDYPAIPDGTTANREQINDAIEQVRDFGTRTNAYLNCQEEIRAEIFLNMNRDQQQRWTDDFNAIVDRLSEIETGLNEQIRIFNQRIAETSENS